MLGTNEVNEEDILDCHLQTWFSVRQSLSLHCRQSFCLYCFSYFWFRSPILLWVFLSILLCGLFHLFHLLFVPLFFCGFFCLYFDQIPGSALILQFQNLDYLFQVAFHCTYRSFPLFINISFSLCIPFACKEFGESLEFRSNISLDFVAFVILLVTLLIAVACGHSEQQPLRLSEAEMEEVVSAVCLEAAASGSSVSTPAHGNQTSKLAVEAADVAASVLIKLLIDM